ncbi:Pol polyprotein [Plakobranchus ocellatus]|uniref:Pol polyprotein n=1 Tax=Plakobranchus ocellatus TaxID=259542 RepID=A0AAV4BUA0_9GAST|nr:Pol polyprotein [Plakobranchus ocellatus]
MDCHYEFLRMPFGMMNSGATLTRAVKKLLCGMDNVVDYIDDLLIHTETWEAHVKTLSELFKRLQEANFTVKPVKCLLRSRTVDLLGHSLGRGAIGLHDENVEKVRDAPRPKMKKEVRAFLGLVGHYKEFVPNFAAVSAPLSDLVRKGQPNIVNWGDSQERAYNSLKVAVTSKPVLQLPNVNKRFVLRTDASDRGLGAALMQENEEIRLVADLVQTFPFFREPKGQANLAAVSNLVTGHFWRFGLEGEGSGRRYRSTTIGESQLTPSHTDHHTAAAAAATAASKGHYVILTCVCLTPVANGQILARDIAHKDLTRASNEAGM